MRVFLALSLFFSNTLFSQVDSTKNIIAKLNFLSLYNVMFDSKHEIRAGVEFEYLQSDKFSWFAYLDAGMYDRYDYYKYFDFFNETVGLHYRKKTVTTYGVNLVSGINYDLPVFKKTKSVKFYISPLLDLNIYHRTLNTTFSNASLTIKDKQFQFCSGLGIAGGIMIRLSNSFFVEVKTNATMLIYRTITKEEKIISALHAQWATANHRFWGLSQIQLGYAF